MHFMLRVTLHIKYALNSGGGNWSVQEINYFHWQWNWSKGWPRNSKGIYFTKETIVTFLADWNQKMSARNRISNDWHKSQGCCLDWTSLSGEQRNKLQHESHQSIFCDTVILMKAELWGHKWNLSLPTSCGKFREFID